MAYRLDYSPDIGGEPYDPAPAGGGVDRLRLFTEPGRTGVPVVDVGPAVVVAPGLYRFTFSEPPDGTYWTAVTWRESAAAEPFVDDGGSIALPPAVRAAHQIITGADLSRATGGSVRRAACDEAADIVSGLIEGWTRGRSLYPDAVPRDLAAVARAASLRLAINLHQQGTVSIGEQSITGAFRGFTITEQVVLNRYRRRSA